MSKDIKDYLHLYLGCEALISSKMDYIEKAEEFSPALSGYINEKFPDIKKIKWEAHDLSFFKPEYVKLLLRPLSDMTEEEAIELAKISEWKQYGEHPHKREYRTYRNGFNQIVVSWGETIREKNVPVTKEVFGFEEFRYLLSKGFDLFGLIDAGLAIDKTKL